MTTAEPRKLLLVEDDAAFARTLTRSFERRGYQVFAIPVFDPEQPLPQNFTPTHAVVDLKLAQGTSGLACVKALHAQDPDLIIVVLTGYASIATAVEAIKLGARHYLAKPANTDDIEAAFTRTAGDVAAQPSARQTSIKTLEWDHIHEALAAADFNISEAARQLGMHRRTLARKLEKRQVK